MAHASHHHQVLIRRVPVPWERAPRRHSCQDDGRPLRGIAALHRACRARWQSRDRYELHLRHVQPRRLTGGPLPPYGAR